MSLTVTVSISRWRASIAAKLAIWRSIDPVLKKKPTLLRPTRGAKCYWPIMLIRRISLVAPVATKARAWPSIASIKPTVKFICGNFRLLRGAKAQSSCTSCHLDVQKFADDAPLLVEGQRLFEQVGCTGCHLVKGYENIPKIAPSLMKISAKVDPSWMVRWIENPA